MPFQFKIASGVHAFFSILILLKSVSHYFVMLIKPGMEPNLMSLCLRNRVIAFHCAKHIKEVNQMTKNFPFSFQIYQ